MNNMKNNNYDMNTNQVALTRLRIGNAIAVTVSVDCFIEKAVIQKKRKAIGAITEARRVAEVKCLL